MLQYRKKPQMRAYTEIFLSLITISVFGAFAIKPTAITIASLLKEIEEKKATLAKTELKIQSLQEAAQAYEQNKGNIALLDTSIPRKPEPEVFSRQIEGLSEKNGVEIVRISTGGGPLFGGSVTETQQSDPNVPAPETPEFQLLPFSVSIRSAINQYRPLSEFASDFLYKTRYPVDMDRVNFVVQEERDDRSLLFTVSGKIPYK